VLCFQVSLLCLFRFDQRRVVNLRILPLVEWDVAQHGLFERDAIDWKFSRQCAFKALWQEAFRRTLFLPSKRLRSQEHALK